MVITLSRSCAKIAQNSVNTLASSKPIPLLPNDQHSLGGYSFVGRATLYGVATGGLAEAQRAIEMLQHELDLAMAQVGCVALEEKYRQILFTP